MLDRNTTIGLVLSAILFILFIYVSNENSKKIQEQNATKAKQEKVEQEKKKIEVDQKQVSVSNTPVNTTNNDSIIQFQNMQRYGAFSSTVTNQVKKLIIENEVMKITFSTKGAMIEQVELKKFKSATKQPLLLTASKDNYYSFVLPLQNNAVLNTADMHFETDASSISISGNDTKTISFKLKSDNGGYLEQVYTLKGNSYMLDHKLNFVDLKSSLQANNIYAGLNWYQTCRKLEAKIDVEKRNSALYYQFNNGTTENITKSKEKVNDIHWIAYKQQFFSSILSIKEGMSGMVEIDYTSEDTSYNKKFLTRVNIPISNNNNTSNSISMEWYLGPNDYTALRKMDKGYETMIPLAGSIPPFSWFGFVNKYAIIPIFNLLKKFTLNYGIIIFILALIIKIVLTPFTMQQSRQSAIMQIMKPELDELKAKYENDPQKYSTEQMKIMSKVGASPLSGCIPLLLQMPILISMYSFFPASIDLRQASFLWANDLSTYDHFGHFGPIFGFDHISIFALLMTITSLINAFVTPQPQSQDNPGMKYMPYIFPIVLFFVFNSFSAALSYYYLLFNVFSIIQVWIIKKFFIDEEKLKAEIHAKKSAPAKKSGWLEKLENYSKQQQEELRKQQRSSKK